MTEEPLTCPDCGSGRDDWTRVCEACGAPPGQERRDDLEAPVRTTDLEPYVALRYIARLFRVLAVLLIIMLIGEVVTGLMMQGREAIVTLMGEATRLIVLSGLLWGAGDIAILLVDLGHDIRVSRILLGRINSELHRQGGQTGEDMGRLEESPRAELRG